MDWNISRFQRLCLCLDTVSDRWEKAEEVENVYKPEVSEQSDKKEDVRNELYMAGGHMTLSQLEATA